MSTETGTRINANDSHAQNASASIRLKSASDSKITAENEPQQKKQFLSRIAIQCGIRMAREFQNLEDERIVKNT
jgi:hypothetical protein